MDSPWTMKYYFYTFKNPTGRRASVREFITRQTCTICDYTVDYMCRTRTSKSPHAFAMCSISTDLLKQENEKIDSLQIYLDFNLLLTNRNLSPITFRLPWWKFNLHLCQEQLRNVRVSQFSSCFSWDDWFCESYTSYARINYACF